MINSCLGLFSATISLWHSFSRSYGVNLPSSLTAILPLVFGFSPRLPVSVCGTGTNYLPRSFSRQCEFRYFDSFVSPSRINFVYMDLPLYTISPLRPTFPSLGYPILLLPSIDHSIISGIGFSTDCPSLTPFDLSLGPDLPWADEPSPGNLRLSTIRILT